ncbi:MAG: hypothetical protein PHS93_08725 [Candidatus Omnitrophica bacterium]|nr:hypothetical protein [Candidatus Omnitrophota bacterium]
MFKELIEKIEVLRIKYSWHDTDIVDQHNFDGNNHAIDHGIEIIKQAIPHPQDKPDCEGWWWFTEGIIQDEIEWIPYYINSDIDGNILKSNREGYWIKAILPEVTA